MKNFSKPVIALVLAVVMAMLLPVQVLASTPDYISEIKVFAGDYSAAQSEGFTLLKNGDKPVNLNEKAGGGTGSQGEKAVYLGYKKTKNKDEAITDLALMNMKGGYDIKEYDILMKKLLKEQIIPFVDSFQAAIEEYRENCKSKNKSNKQRADYIRSILNKFIDDDTGNALGDLLLNKTKYEMGDEAYNKLSDSEKKNHADILTIIAQSNGAATLMMENLLTRAADTSDDTWLERFSETTYEDLLNYSDMTPSEARKKVYKLYHDDAQTILDGWEDFRTQLLDYDKYKKVVENFDADAVEAAINEFSEIDSDTSSEKTESIVEAYLNAKAKLTEMMKASEIIAIHDYLSGIDYLDSTMLDFFTRDSSEVEDEITSLFPIVASLSDGQRAGLEFVNLIQLVTIAMTNGKNYSDSELDVLEETSIYEGVDRGIYQKGGVALTSDAMRSDIVNEDNEENGVFGKWTIATMVITGVIFAGVIASATGWIVNAKRVASVNKLISADAEGFLSLTQIDKISELREIGSKFDAENPLGYMRQLYATKSSFFRAMTVGLSVALVALTVITLVLTYRDMVNHYKVEFTPIPRYMVDKKDITGFNSKGEKIILKNQSAYYKAVLCNRNSKDKMFNNLGDIADLNGDVGKQWLALYAETNNTKAPILADSLTVVVNDTKIPAGYKTGIHMFDSDAAFNLNSSLYDWNASAPSVYVYFKTDETSASTTGTNITAGTLALSGGAGIALGALATAFGMTVTKKKKRNAVA